MVRQVLVEPARSDGSRPCERERGERVWVVERGDLGDHPADAHARQVRRSVLELAGEGRGVGCEITQCVLRSLGIDRGRGTAVAQVVAHDVTIAARERLAERVGPGEHGRGAREQNERRRRVAEVLDPERDAVCLDRRHDAFAVARTPTDVRTERAVGYIVDPQGEASWPGGTLTAARAFALASRETPECNSSRTPSSQ